MAHPRVLRFDERLLTRMLNHLADAVPNEGCGLIAFDGGRPVEIYPGTNILQSATRYRMAEPEVLRAVEDMDRKGWWLGAIYHSHPHSPPEPSTTDLREANWPDALMIIVSFMSGEPEAKAWHIEHLSFEPVEIEVETPRLGARWRDRLVQRALSLVSTGDNDTPGGSEAPTLAAPPRAPAVSAGAQGGDVSPAGTLPPNPPGERRAMIGILGGMGPLATADLYRKIILATPATSDQTHIPVVIWADPRVPDRTEALLAGGEDPTPWLIGGGQALASMGADFIVMPCNTAHAFLEQVQPAVERPFLSMVDAAVDDIVRSLPEVTSVGLLATSGTISSGVYQRSLEARGLAAVIPDDDHQTRCVMTAIRAVKAGDTGDAPTALFVEAGGHLAAGGAQALIAACTEIPVVLRQEHVDLPLVDATDALARLAVDTARHLDEAARGGAPEWETSQVPWVADAAK
jgi:aspartate racemase